MSQSQDKVRRFTLRGLPDLTTQIFSLSRVHLYMWRLTLLWVDKFLNTSCNYVDIKTFMTLEGTMLNILLVDDDDVDVMNVQRAFKKNNIPNPLFVASNGIEALEMLRGEPSVVPYQRRLILLDLNMPQMGGIEFLKEIRADDTLKSIPVVVLTTSNEDNDKVEAYQLNVAGYILKPVTFSRFLESMVALNKYWMLCEMP